jgi:uncharacterized membrane protein YgaE (UPF0421/DUF939 family)
MHPRHFEAITFSAKAALSALVGVEAYNYLPLPGSVWVVAVSAVIVTQINVDSSLRASLLRVAANLGGAFCGAVLVLLIGAPPAAMAIGIMLTGLACFALKHDDLLRPAAVAVILVTLAGKTNEWDVLRTRILGVIAGCVCAVVVGFLFDTILEHTKLRPTEKPDKSDSQE